LYRHDGLLMRLIMQAISRSSGTPTDVKRDHVLTDWGALDRFAEDFARDLGAARPAIPSSGMNVGPTRKSETSRSEQTLSRLRLPRGMRVSS
jgi:hypothetical protein